MASKFGGMHAKDRMAMFEKKTDSAPKKTVAGPKKIGKLNIGNKNNEDAIHAPIKKPLKKVHKKDDSKTAKPEEHKQEKAHEVKKEAPKPEVKQVEPKPEVKQVEPKVEVKQVEPKVEVKQVEPKVEVKQVEPKVEVKQVEPKVEVKQVEPKVEVKQVEPKVEVKQVEPKVTKEEPKPQEKQQEPNPEVKQEEPKAEKTKEVNPVEAKVESKTDPKVNAKPEEPKPVTEVKEDKPAETKQNVKPEPVVTQHVVKAIGKEEPKQEKPVEAKKAEPKPEAKKEPSVKAPAPAVKLDDKKVTDSAKKEPAQKPAQKNAPVDKEGLKPVSKETPAADKPAPKARKEAAKQPTEAVATKDIQEAEAAVKAAQEAAVSQQPKRRRVPQYKPVPEEFYDTLFYFSGMGTVVGSAISEGVYVPPRSSRTALGTEIIEQFEQEKEKEREQETYVIKKARTQAFTIAEELRKLQLLLGAMPNFGENEGLHKIDTKPVDTVLHAHYFQSDKPVEHHRKPTGIQVTLESKVVAPPKAPQQQWPPPIVPKPQPEIPINVDSAPRVHAAPPHPMSKGVGVFTAERNPKTNPLAWQQKYGTASVDDIRVPQPFGEGEISAGLKPWELSRLRGLEAKGYHFEHQEPLSGADYSDSFYHGEAAPEMVRHHDTQKSSLAPFLVSGRSQSVDREELLGHPQQHLLQRQTHQHVAYSPRPTSLGQLTPSFHGSHASLPFSDL